MTASDELPSSLLGPLLTTPGDAAVLVDFDGTLAPIVTNPSEAVPLPGADDVLRRLAQRFAMVAVVSGRPVAYLAPHIPDGVHVSGLYGLEARSDGATVRHPDAARWAEVVRSVVVGVRSGAADALEVEDKGLSLTVHFRRHPAQESEAIAWATSVAERTGLEVRRAKQSVELHPPVTVDKGTVVEALAAEVGAACFVGDDRGDLPAFDALDRLAAGGTWVLRVAVVTSETAPELAARADLTVDGPAGALALLERLAA